MAVSDELQELNEIWQEVKKSFSNELSDSTIDLWFGGLVLTDFADNTIHFRAPTSFKCKMVRERHLERIKKGFFEFLGFEVDVNVFFASENVTRITHRVIPYEELGIEREPITPARKEVEIGSAHFPYHFEYTFDNFIVGKSNNFAHAACLGVAENPACMESERISGGKEVSRTYNPLFIYGPSGLGKTHLLHAIINKIKSNIPDVKMLYVTCEDFTNQLIDHLSTNSMNMFKEKYRKCDVLLIDDIQFLEGKKSTQEEFFHTFNALYEEHKQIILTSDRPPREIQPLEERLVNRFEWGLIADIQPPDMELRLAIIKKKAEQIGIELPEDVLEYLAENLRSNVRQIEGAIKKLGAQKFLSGKEITFELAKGCISDLMDGEEPINVIIDKIFKSIEAHYGVTKDELLSESRKQEIAFARHVTTYLIKELTDLSYKKIAKTLNRRNHTTCLSSCTQVEEKLKNDTAFISEINAIKKEIEKK